MDKNQLIEVGTFREEFNTLAGTNLPIDIIYQSPGVLTHMTKSGHSNCLQYLSQIQDIINNPDYVGKHPKIGDSIELVKIFDQNILVAIKLDTTENYLYVSSMYEITESKINQRLHSGRLKHI